MHHPFDSSPGVDHLIRTAVLRRLVALLVSSIVLQSSVALAAPQHTPATKSKAAKATKAAKSSKAQKSTAPVKTKKIAPAEPEPSAQGNSTTPGVPEPPAVPVRAFILIDAATGRMLTGAGPDERVEPASITKLMTAYVVFQAIAERRVALTDNVTISERAWRAEGSRTFLQVGTQVPVETLLKGMIVQSGNDAATALAERVGGSVEGFATMMNQPRNASA